MIRKEFNLAVSNSIRKLAFTEHKDKGLVEDDYKIGTYHCRASFLPQPYESSECPSATLPFKDIFCKSWESMQAFILECKDWPYIEIVANIMRNQKGQGYRTGSEFPVHIFYRRLKPQEKESD